MKNKLSVVLALYNEEKELDGCLSSLDGIADELVIVDGGSADKTLQIAKKYKAHIIQTNNPPIFHINKQKAVDAATGNWILQLDADERLTRGLRTEILQITRNSKFSGEARSRFARQFPNSNAGFYIKRKNYFCGKFMRYGGMYPDPVIRLFKRGKGIFPCKSVHEQIVINGSVGTLEWPMEHFTYRTFTDYMKKADRYTSLTAYEMMNTESQQSVMTLFRYVLFKPAWTFIMLYFRHQGIRDGWWGFVWAGMSAFHFPIAYIKFLHLKNRI